MHRVRWVIPFALFLGLGGCGGYGPIYTCKTDCTNPNEYRDLFCTCQKKGSGAGPPPPVTEHDPYLDRIPVQNSCTSFQERDVIVNPHKAALDVQIGFKVPDGSATGSWDQVWYTVPAGGRKDLGLKYISPNCFDQDFFIQTWQEHRGANLDGTRVSLAQPVVSLETALNVLDPSARARVEIQSTEFYQVHKRFSTQVQAQRSDLAGSTVPIKHELVQLSRLNCLQVCHDSLDLRCLSNRPPDQDKIFKLRDKILSTRANSVVATADILAIFGMSNDPCARGKTNVDSSSHVSNDGGICSYPIVLNASDKTPVAAFVIARNLSGEASGSPSKNVTLTFFKPYERPSLLFSKSAIQNDYGGSVFELSADSQGVYFGTPNSCVALQVSP